VGRGQPLELDAMIGDQLFIGRYDAFARFERAPHPAAGRVEAAGQLDDHIHIAGGQQRIGVFGPGHARGNPVGALAHDATIEDMGQFQTRGLRFDQNSCHRSAHRSETEEGNAQGARATGGFG
jgi:hypothetical protein